YDCALYTGVCYRLNLAQWRMEAGEEIPTHCDGVPRSTLDIMLDVNRAFETAVRRDPANWFWVHNRWKPKAQVQSPKSKIQSPRSLAAPAEHGPGHHRSGRRERMVHRAAFTGPTHRPEVSAAELVSFRAGSAPSRHPGSHRLRPPVAKLASNRRHPTCCQ